MPTTRSVSTGAATFYLVLEFCEHDLRQTTGQLYGPFLDEREQKSDATAVECAVFHTLAEDIASRHESGQHFDHQKRGLKAGRLWSRPSHQLREYNKRYTNRVITLWYRPPEPLLGERNHDSPVDLWGAGCIMAECFMGLTLTDVDPDPNNGRHHRLDATQPMVDN
ncbi:unnamed protein product [Medioppia subpectinata]|uniref:Protein kinase domain-containing protein n=1 Tax=Medioppia subpectinata TaxID=1979941 RepID=A0A7R9KKB0_9ACAR|nr:unnamed protein product [Medioppia subpectinata]CAG2104902.1 unnamed protein product [Medioppia subpectinata]